MRKQNITLYGIALLHNSSIQTVYTVPQIEKKPKFTTDTILNLTNKQHNRIKTHEDGNFRRSYPGYNKIKNDQIQMTNA